MMRSAKIRYRGRWWCWPRYIWDRTIDQIKRIIEWLDSIGREID